MPVHKILFHRGGMFDKALLLLFPFELTLFGQINHQSGSNENRGIGAEQDAEQKRKSEAFDTGTSKNEQSDHHQKGRCRGDKCPAQGIVDGEIEDFFLGFPCV